MKILQEENNLQELIQLIGPDSLQPHEQVILETARMIREDFLQQNAYHKVDTFCPGHKGYRMLEIILKFHNLINEAVKRDVEIMKIKNLNCRERIGRMATVPNKDYKNVYLKLEKDIENEINTLK